MNSVPIIHQATKEELHQDAKLAWKHANKCIGRAHWNSLELLDVRGFNRSTEIFDALFHHIEYATNHGAIRSVISVFDETENGEAGARILNHQLIRYAGYRLDNGQILGDPQSVTLTYYLMQHGWQPPSEPSAFDVLPIAIKWPNQPLIWKEIPTNLVLQVPIRHPELAWFEQLNLKWYAVPIISDMVFKTASAQYTAAPFNGYYMGTEVGSRNFGDEQRYNLLPLVAEKMGLDRRNAHSLWKDRALTELNTAVLWSFKEAGVRMVDHHTASAQHVAWEEAEARKGCPVTGNWSWLVPPAAGSACPVFHRNYDNTEKVPGFFYASDAFE